MNIFKLFGKFFAVQKESEALDKAELVARYREVEASPELKEYLELDKIVESDEFVQKRYNWKNKDYRMTPIHDIAGRYKELLHDEKLQAFLEIESSKRLKDFLAFKASKDYAKLQDTDAVANSPELLRMYKFEQSKDYKLYLQYCDSPLPKEYKELVAKMETPEFKKEYAFWTNPNRWKTTDEYQQEVRYKLLAKRADIRFYLKQDSAEIARWEKELAAKRK